MTIANTSVSVSQVAGGIPCGAGQQVAGGDLADTRSFQMGKTSGSFVFIYDTYSQQDRMIVSYGTQTLFDTGCVGTNGDVTRTLTYSGSSSVITVQVIPNCFGGSGTGWDYTLKCPT